jgi:hypothetical protein
LRLLLAKTTLFQPKDGRLYLFRDSQPTQLIGDGHELYYLTSEGDDDIWALVDGDLQNVQPHPSLLYGPRNVRIIMASSPRVKSDRKWMKYTDGAEILMDLWTPSELFFAAYVLSLN